jgi:hypothetical protein
MHNGICVVGADLGCFGVSCLHGAQLVHLCVCVCVHVCMQFERLNALGADGCSFCFTTQVVCAIAPLAKHNEAAHDDYLTPGQEASTWVVVLCFIDKQTVVLIVCRLCLFTGVVIV